MKRTTAVATLLSSMSAALSAFAQYPPQQYPPQQQQPYPQQYPPQQQYPQQYPPQQQYQQPYQQAPMTPVPQSYAPPPPTTASNATFGGRGQVIFSADRLFGLSFWSAKTEGDNNTSATDSGTAVNLLWGDTTGVSGPYSTPRLGVDFTVTDNFSVGGSIGFLSRSGKSEVQAAGVTQSADLPTITGFVFTPRAGYILAINPMLGVWFKGGITYFNIKQEQTATNNGASVTRADSVNGFGLNIEPELVITPVPHFGLTIGGVADIALSGNAKTEFTGAQASSTEHPNKINNFGIIAGILGHI